MVAPEQEAVSEEEYSLFWRCGSTVGLILLALFCLMVTVQTSTVGYARIAGYSIFRVVTGSMEPTIPSGAVLLSKEVGIETIASGDIICYRAKIPEIYNSVVTHRVVNVITGTDGQIYLETQGDANVVSDIWYVDKDSLVGRVVWYSGKGSLITGAVSFLSGQIGFFSCVVFPLLLMTGLIMRRTVKNLHREIRNVREQIAREQERREPEAAELLPGYATLTRKDYEELYDKLKQELAADLKET